MINNKMLRWLGKCVGVLTGLMLLNVAAYAKHDNAGVASVSLGGGHVINGTRYYRPDESITVKPYCAYFFTLTRHAALFEGNGEPGYLPDNGGPPENKYIWGSPYGGVDRFEGEFEFSQEKNTSVDPSAWKDGAHTLTYVCTRGAVYYGDADYTIKGSAPTVALASPSPAENSWIQGNKDIDIAVKVSDWLGVNVKAGAKICWVNKRADGDWPVCGNENSMSGKGDNVFHFSIPHGTLTEGDLAVGFYAEDVLGNGTDNANGGAWPKKYFKIDRTAPTLTVVSPVGTWSKDGKIQVKVKDEGSGVDTTHGVNICWSNKNAGGAWNTCSGDSPMTSKENGVYEFTLPDGIGDGDIRLGFDAQDKVGNQVRDSSGWLKQEIKLDRTQPEVTWDDSSTKFVKDGAATIKAKVTDVGSGVDKVWVKWPGSLTNIEMTKGSGDLYTYTIDAAAVKKLGEGAQAVSIWARDKLGNETGWQEKGSFMVDQTAPEVTWDDSSTKFVKDGAATLKFQVKDEGSGVGSVWISWSGDSVDGEQVTAGEDGTYSYTINATKVQKLTEGVHGVKIRATDKLGNDTVWVEKGSFTVDRTGPVLTLASPQEDSWNKDLSIVVSVRDSTSGVDFGKGVQLCWKAANAQYCGTGVPMKRSLDGDTYEYTIMAENLTEGRVQVGFYAQDMAGNTTNPGGGGYWLKKNFLIDKNAPTVIWDKNNAKYSKDDRITLNATVTDKESGVASVSLRFSGFPDLLVPMTLGSGNIFSADVDSSVLPEGLTKVEIKADDHAGNSTGWLSEGQFTIPQRDHNKQPDKLKLEKAVYPKTDVLPGETLTYTLKFTNMSAEPLHDLVIRDNYPARYTSAKLASCGDMQFAGAVVCCVVSDKGGQCTPEPVATPAQLEWRIKGALPSGGVGTVTYELQVHDVSVTQDSHLSALRSTVPGQPSRTLNSSP